MPYRDRENEKTNQKKWYQENQERILESKKQYYNNNKERIAKYQQTTIGRFSKYKTGAKKRNYSFSLTFEQFENLISLDCTYCGSNGYGVDRVDSSKGYEIENCVSCCSKCNMMKNNNSVKEFLNHCKKIVDHNKLK